MLLKILWQIKMEENVQQKLEKMDKLILLVKRVKGKQWVLYKIILKQIQMEIRSIQIPKLVKSKWF